MTEYHCIYAGICEDGYIYCHYPGMDCVDATCSGYDNCEQYESDECRSIEEDD